MTKIQIQFRDLRSLEQCNNQPDPTHLVTLSPRNSVTGLVSEDLRLDRFHRTVIDVLVDGTCVHHIDCLFRRDEWRHERFIALLPGHGHGHGQTTNLFVLVKQQADKPDRVFIRQIRMMEQPRALATQEIGASLSETTV